MNDEFPQRRFARGRIVMLVENDVRRDSRVQKQATSAAAAGWEVFLLGVSRGDTEERWQLGQAQVRLLPPVRPLRKRRCEFRRSWRHPLAYPPNGIADYRLRRVVAWRSDLATRLAELDLARAPARLSRTRLWWRGLMLAIEAMASTFRLLWIKFRYEQLQRANSFHRRATSGWARFVTWFWLTTLGERAWRRLQPTLWEYELIFGKVIDQLQPDIIHANDFITLGPAARAVLRARAAGRRVRLVWDVHELVVGMEAAEDDVRYLPALIAAERNYARYADAVITVSDELADDLRRRYRLAQRPTVVLNTPQVDRGAAERAPNLREVCGVEPQTPLLVYSGYAAPARGVETIIEAMPLLPEVHVALVVSHPPQPYVQRLAARAASLGAGSRLHLAPYVPPDQVVEYLSSADAGVHPTLHFPNHEISLATKYFEYAHARLPLIISDVRTMGETTRELGLGEVFRAGDVEDFARAVKLVLANPARYRAAYDRPGLLESWTWRSQAEILDSVYARFAPPQPRRVPGNRPDVSVLVAVHNARAQLKRTVGSLLRQSIGLDCLELIAVDNSSSDGSGRCLDRFATTNPGTVQVMRRHRGGGGLADAYNLALNAARGRYVLAVRPGDYLEPDALDRMVAAADESGSDVVVRRCPEPASAGSAPPREPSDATPLAAPAVGLLLRRDTIQRLGLRFDERMRLASDQGSDDQGSDQGSGLGAIGRVTVIQQPAGAPSATSPQRVAGHRRLHKLMLTLHIVEHV